MLVQRLLWLARRPLVLLKALRAFGWSATARIFWVRCAGSPNEVYRFRFRSLAHPVYVRGGSSSDLPVCYQILANQEYALQLPPNEVSLIIDGGANIGITSLLFLNLFPAARVISVEPDPENARICTMNLRPYVDRATVLQGAIWSTSSNLRFEPARSSLSGTVFEDQSGSIRAYSIADLLGPGAKYIDLLKLDIEGSELQVFGPSAQLWLPRTRNIVIELHGEPHRERFLEALKDYVFELSIRQVPAGFYVATCQNIVPSHKTMTALA